MTPPNDTPATSQSSPPIAPAAPSFLAGLLETFTRDDPRRGRSALIVVTIMLVIAWLDYITGLRVSLNLFYVAPIALAVSRLGWKFAAAIALASVALRTIGDYYSDPTYFRSLAPTLFWNRMVDLAVYIALLLIFNAHVSLSRQLEARIHHRTTALERAVAARQRLQAQLFEISRRERNAIGRDLHDGLGQHLTATAMAADVLSNRLSQESHPAAKDAQTLAELMQSGVSQTRQIARGLLLAAVEPDELVPELEELAATVAQEQGVFCRFTRRGKLGPLDGSAASHLFYIAQEAVSNALRHGNAKSIEIDLTSSGEAVALTITDDGCGLDPANPAQNVGMGLRIMAHRAELIGGTFSIGPGTVRGTTVRCRVPLPLTPAPALAEA